MKRNKRDMPQWFGTEEAKFFRKNISKEEYCEMMNRINGMHSEARNKGINPKDVSMYWYKSKSYSLMVKQEKQDLYKVFEEEVIPKIEEIAITYPPNTYQSIEDNPTLALLKISDAHWGKLGKKHNLKIISNLVLNCSNRLLNRLKKNHKVERIVIKGGDDALHVDNSVRTTTKGTPQDTDGMWYDAFNEAFETIVRVIEKCIEVAPVSYYHCPSNHDRVLGFCLSKCIEAYFSECKDVTFFVDDDALKALQYGRNLIGLAHGHTSNEQRMIRSLSELWPKAWATTSYRYLILGHLHHKIQKQDKDLKEKEHGTLTVLRPSNIEHGREVIIDYAPSLSGTDKYHKDNGYYGQRRAIEMDIFCPENGRINVMTEVAIDSDFEI